MDTNRFQDPYRESKPPEPDSGAASARPSQQVAFMQAEAEELAKLLSMASTVATLLERCEEIGRGSPSLQGDSPASERLADPMTARALTSIRSAASGAQRVQRGVFRQLMQSTLVVTQHLSQAAALALRGLPEDGAPPETGEQESGLAESRGRVIQLRAERYQPFEEPVPRVEGRTVSAEARPPERPRDPARLGPSPGVERPRQSGPADPPIDPEPSPRDEPRAPAPSARRPLDSWLRALANYYAFLLTEGSTRAGVTASRSGGQAMPAGTVVETKVAISGAFGLSELMAAYRALTGLGGVQEVSLVRITPDIAELLVRHSPELDLASAIAFALGGPVRVARAEPGILALEVGAATASS